MVPEMKYGKVTVRRGLRVWSIKHGCEATICGPICNKIGIHFDNSKQRPSAFANINDLRMASDWSQQLRLPL